MLYVTHASQLCTYFNNEEITLITHRSEEIEFHSPVVILRNPYTLLRALLNFTYFTHTLITNFGN